MKRCSWLPSRPRRRRWLALPLLGGMLLLAGGCTAGGRVSRTLPAAPQISPQEIASQALAEFDANQDGVLDTKELERCPALKTNLRQLDRNNDNRLSAEEIADRLTLFQQGGMLTAVSVQVSSDMGPIREATVTLTPEKFLGPSFKTATGVTDPSGTACMKAEGTNEEWIPAGYYRLTVSKKNAAGQETLPARYNTKTVLGYEVAPPSVGRGGGGTIVVEMKLR